MGTISIDFPDEHRDTIIDAVCARYQYENQKLPDETKGQFAKRMAAKTIKQMVVNAIANKHSDEQRAIKAEEINQIPIT